MSYSASRPLHRLFEKLHHPYVRKLREKGWYRNMKGDYVSPHADRIIRRKDLKQLKKENRYE